MSRICTKRGLLKNEPGRDAYAKLMKADGLSLLLLACLSSQVFSERFAGSLDFTALLGHAGPQIDKSK